MQRNLCQLFQAGPAQAVEHEKRLEAGYQALAVEWFVWHMTY